MVFVLASSAVFAQQPADTTDANHQFAKLLTSQYGKYHNAGARGDVAAYLKLRTSDIAKKMTVVSSTQLIQYSKADFDPAEYKFLRIEARTKIARAMWEKKTPEAATYQLVMFSLEDGEWKVGNILEGINAGDMAMVPGPTGLEQLLQHRRAQLPEK